MSLFFIFCIVNMVMAIDVLMKYAFRFLHSVSGFVSVGIRNFLVMVELFIFCGFFFQLVVV